MKATIRLFKAVEIKSKRGKKPTKKLLAKTIKKGFAFSPEVVFNYSESELAKLIKIVEKEVGLTAKKMNSSFHKSWIKVKEAGIEQLVVEQLAHYLTTYGAEEPEEYLIEKGEQWGVDNLGAKVIGLGDFKSDKIKDKNYVYIPKEKLEIPDLDIDGIRLIVIKGYTKKELKDKLLVLLESGIALQEDTIKDVIEVAVIVGIDEKDIDRIRNKEVKIALYDNLNLFPENPVELVRFAIFKSINKTLLIKDKTTIEEIKSKKNRNVLKLLYRYEGKYGLERLAQVFYRLKPIFLAFKSDYPPMNRIINKIRKLAKKHHKPIQLDYLNEITAKIKRGEKITKDRLINELAKANIFRRIRLAYALKFRAKDASSIMYRIRNGKSYAAETETYNEKQTASTKRILDIVIDSIVKDISPNIKGKKIYIPEYITYALPATEKQFTGDFPSGSYVSIPKDMVFGIHWENVKGDEIDLDLSLINSNGKIGWDAAYRTRDKKILFSGDVTDAPKPDGASELFYVRRQAMDANILLVNYYNYDEDIVVPFSIIVAKEEVKHLVENYMVNPNNIMAMAKTKMDQKQKILGLLVTTMSECRFYFTETYLGKSITSSKTAFAENARQYLFDFYRNTISLNSLIEKAGGEIVRGKEKCDIDLSPENLEKDKIIKLIVWHPNNNI